MPDPFVTAVAIGISNASITRAITLVNEEWVRHLLAEPLSDEWLAVPILQHAFVQFGGGFLRLYLKRYGGGWWGGWVYCWYVYNDHGIVAAGTAREVRERDHVLEFGSSAVTTEWRSIGLYRTLLPVIAKLFGGPIESGSALSPGAREAWRYAGGVETHREGRPVMRLEPA